VSLRKYFYLANPTQQSKHNKANGGRDPLIVLHAERLLEDVVEV
jgi:hypothetical protein